MSLRIDYTDARGTAETLTSAQTSPIANVNDAPVGLPVIAGTATEDQTLSVDATGISDADGLGAFSYQWRRDGVSIAGATSATYLLGDADVGTRITVRVSYTDARGTAETVTSAQTAPIANVNDVPTGSPVVSGTPTEDQTLSADTTGIADADGLGAFTYQWLRDGVAVVGATGTTYLPGDADVGAQIGVRVSWTDARGTAQSLTSAPTAAIANVNDVPGGSVAVSGTLTEDQTLTAVTSGISDIEGLGAFAYQWLRDGSAIAGATASTYLLGDADVGTQVSVRVSWIDGWGTAESLMSSGEVDAVANLNDAPVIVSDGGGASATIVLDENTTAVTTVVAQDADADPLVYALAGGADRARFAIDAATGALRFLAPPDHEAPADADGDNVYEVVVSASDGQVASLQTLRLRVAGVNEAPTLRAPASVAALEDTPRLLSAADGTAIVVGDPDVDQAELSIDLMVDRGTLTLGTRAGLRFDGGGDGIDDASIRVSGSPADIADALAQLLYLPPADASGAAVLTLTARDPALPQLAASVSISIGIAAVNDAPVLRVEPVEARRVVPGGATPIGREAIVASDIDSVPSEVIYTLEQPPAAGRMVREGVTLAAGDRFTQADVDAGRIEFVAPSSGGMQSIVLSVSDAGGASSGQRVTMKFSVDTGQIAQPGAAGGFAAAAGSSLSAPSASALGAPAPGGSSAAMGAGDAESGADTARPGGQVAAPADARAAGGGISAASRGASASATPTAAAATPVRPGNEVWVPPRGDASEASGRNVAASGILRQATDDRSDASDRSDGPADLSASGAAGSADHRRLALAGTPETRALAARAGSPMLALRESDFARELDESREGALAGFELREAVVASSMVAATSLSLGYVVWVLRGGVLLTGLLASLPAWRSIDPLPVLARVDAQGRDDAGEDDSLRGLLRSAADRVAEQARPPTAHAADPSARDAATHAAEST